MTEGSGPSVRLITIPISHCCEKARWALERAGAPAELDFVAGLLADGRPHRRWSSAGARIPQGDTR